MQHVSKPLEKICTVLYINLIIIFILHFTMYGRDSSKGKYQEDPGSPTGQNMQQELQGYNVASDRSDLKMEHPAQIGGDSELDPKSERVPEIENLDKVNDADQENV